jgi:hypothetical protein
VARRSDATSRRSQREPGDHATSMSVPCCGSIRMIFAWDQDGQQY